MRVSHVQAFYGPRDVKWVFGGGVISADLDRFLRGLALWFNEGIETGQWGNETEEDPYSTDSKNLLLSELVRDGSDEERLELQGQTRHAHLDIDGMEIDAEPESLVACGEVDKVVTDGC